MAKKTTEDQAPKFEMTRDELAMRLICSTSRVNSDRLKKKQLSNEKDEMGLDDFERIDNLANRSRGRCDCRGCDNDRDGQKQEIVDAKRPRDSRIGTSQTGSV